MKQMKKILCGMMGLLIIMGQILPVYADANVSAVVAELKNVTKTYQAGEKVDLSIIIKNTDGNKLENIIVQPKYSSNVWEWPFQEVESLTHRKTIQELNGNSQTEVIYTGLTVRKDVGDGRCQVKFTVSKAADTSEVSVYPFTAATPEVINISGASQEASGSFSNGEANASYGGSSNASVPRVIVTGFSTDPAEVKAGSDFKLIVHLKNTSKNTKVQNMEFNFAAPVEGSEGNASPAFLPKSGSNTVYLEGIAANGTANVEIQLNAKSDLVQKPYSIELEMKYEDREAAQFDAKSSISIPIKQEARFEFSDIELSPEAIMVDDETSVMCNLYNMGRIKLYNMKVSFVGTSISAKDTFIGNVEPGATAAIDALLTGIKPTMGEETIKMIITYEDEGGQVHTAEKEFKIMVSEAEEEMMGEEMMIDEGMPQGGGSIIVLLGLGLLIAIVVVTIVIVVKKKKKKAEGDGLKDELDRLIKDE